MPSQRVSRLVRGPQGVPPAYPDTILICRPILGCTVLPLDLGAELVDSAQPRSPKTESVVSASPFRAIPFAKRPHSASPRARPASNLG